MGDVLVRGMTLDGYVKITAVRTTEITRRAREIHHTTAVAICRRWRRAASP